MRSGVSFADNIILPTLHGLTYIYVSAKCFQTHSTARSFVRSLMSTTTVITDYLAIHLTSRGCLGPMGVCTVPVNASDVLCVHQWKLKILP